MATLTKAREKEELAEDELRQEQAVLESGVGNTGPESNMAGELERVRDLLFGRQVKAQDTRLINLENQIQAVRKDLTETLNERFSTLNQSLTGQVEALRKDLNARLDQQGTRQQADLQSAQKAFGERIDLQEKDQTEKLRTAQRTLSDRIDAFSSDVTSQMRAMQDELSGRTEAAAAELTSRIDALQQETRVTDNKLREELLALSGALGSQKISRREMTQLLVELAHRLQNEDTKS